MTKTNQTTDQGTNVQSDEGTNQSLDQGLLAPYLEDVAPEIRPQVESVLKEFQSATDRNANQKIQAQAERIKQFEELGDVEDLQFAMDLFVALRNEPVDTVKWVVDQFKEEQDRDLRSELLTAFGAAVEALPEQKEEIMAEISNETLTKAQVEEMLNTFKAEEEEKYQSKAEADEAAVAVNQWIDAAATKFDVSLDPADREIMITRAARLTEAEDVSGEVAIEMTVEAYATRLDELVESRVKRRSKAPKVADAGSGQLPENADPTESRDVRMQMAEAILRRNLEGD